MWAPPATVLAGKRPESFAGAGIGLLRSFLAKRSTHLRASLPPRAIPPRDLWLVIHDDVRSDAALRAVTEWLTNMLAEGEQSFGITRFSDGTPLGSLRRSTEVHS